MTIPNILSTIRLVLAFVIGYLLYTNQKLIAILLIIIAWITDLLDGYLARKLNAISELGKILDPLADKILILLIVLSLLANNTITLVTSLFIILRDVIILLAGLVAARKYKFVIPSNYIGKISAFLIGLSLFILLLNFSESYKYPIEVFIRVIAVVSIILYSFYYFKWVQKLKSS